MLFPFTPLTQTCASGPTWVMLLFISWPLVADPYLMDSPQATCMGKGHFTKKAMRDRQKATDVYPLKDPFSPSSPRPTFSAPDSCKWMLMALMSPHFGGDTALSSHTGSRWSRLPSSTQAFLLPSLAWEGGPFGTLPSHCLGSQSGDGWGRAGPGLDFLTFSLFFPQHFYSWFFNTITMK